MSTEKQSATPIKQPVTVSVTLEEPIVRGGETIETLVIRRPRAGELRGLSLTEVANMKTDAMVDLLPRITQPSLLKHEVEAMGPADFISCAMEVATFLAPQALVAGVSKT
ncbi:phage tail assembly protein [Diaphorobacter caeni]|uniref:phage tail assembly protein n=1 Tax=Diaphorobacter caeni TaxID=2784387 RepID=UPI0018907E2D|nr:phage tail assembly protein [Diaphorobacter caeni]MBF5003377.1 phage tail assembly protein [Diaphorobacter caeni]